MEKQHVSQNWKQQWKIAKYDGGFPLVVHDSGLAIYAHPQDMVVTPAGESGRIRANDPKRFERLLAEAHELLLIEISKYPQLAKSE